MSGSVRKLACRCGCTTFEIIEKGENKPFVYCTRCNTVFGRGHSDENEGMVVTPIP